MEDENISPEGALVVDFTPTGDISLDTLALSNIKQQLADLYGKDYLLHSAQQDIVEHTSSFREYKQLETETQMLVASNIQCQEGYVPKEKFTTEMLVTGMVDIIENKSDVDTAFATVAKEYNKPEEFIIENKNNRIYNQKEVVSTVKVKAKRKVRQLKKHNLFDEDTLMKSSTSNQLFDNTYRDMLILGEIDSLKERVSNLELRVTLTESGLDSINKVLGIKQNEQKLLSIRLKELGYTQQEISEKLGVSTRTIRNWWKTLF